MERQSRTLNGFRHFATIRQHGTGCTRTLAPNGRARRSSVGAARDRCLREGRRRRSACRRKRRRPARHRHGLGGVGSGSRLPESGCGESRRSMAGRHCGQRGVARGCCLRGHERRRHRRCRVLDRGRGEDRLRPRCSGWRLLERRWLDYAGRSALGRQGPVDVRRAHGCGRQRFDGSGRRIEERLRRDRLVEVLDSARRQGFMEPLVRSGLGRRRRDGPVRLRAPRPWISWRGLSREP